MLTPDQQSDMKWACQAALLEMCHTDINYPTMRKYILQEATYEQLLNAAFNPFGTDVVYMESADLEDVALTVFLEGYVSTDVLLREEDDKEPKEKGKWRRRAKKAAIGTAAVGAVGTGAAIGAGVSAARKELGATSKGPIGSAVRATGRGIGHVAKSPFTVAKKVSDYADKTKIGSAINKSGAATASHAGGVAKAGLKGAGKGALGTAAVLAAGYLAYKLMKKKGASNSEAAQSAANSAKTPEEKAKWAGKAKAYKSQGK